MIESPIVGPSPLEKAEIALRYLESIIRHDQSRITRQPANGIKSAASSLSAAVEIMRREAQLAGRTA